MEEWEIERIKKTIAKKSDFELIVWHYSTRVNTDFCNETKCMVVDEMKRRGIDPNRPWERIDLSNFTDKQLTNFHGSLQSNPDLKADVESLACQEIARRGLDMTRGMTVLADWIWG